MTSNIIAPTSTAVKRQERSKECCGCGTEQPMIGLYCPSCAPRDYPADNPPHLLECPACGAPSLDVSTEFTYVTSACTACPWRNHLADAPRLLPYWLPLLSASIERLATVYGLVLAPIITAQLVADIHPLSALNTVQDYLQQAATNVEYATPAPTQLAWAQRRAGAAFTEARWFRQALWATVTAVYQDRGEAI